VHTFNLFLQKYGLFSISGLSPHPFGTALPFFKEKGWGMCEFIKVKMFIIIQVSPFSGRLIIQNLNLEWMLFNGFYIQGGTNYPIIGPKR